MPAKIIQISDDSGTNKYTLPGGTGDISKEASQISDTIFGQTFDSNEVGLIQWNVSANALYKGFAGYLSKIYKQGSTTAVAAEACTLLSGKIYQIDDITKRIWDRAIAIAVLDGVTDVTDEVESIDYLFGKVTFVSTYTVIGAVTVDINYFPLVVLGKGRSFTLTMQANNIDTTTFELAQANGGYMTNDPGLRTVAIDLEGVEDTTGALDDELAARNELIVEIDAVGDGLALARGFFKVINYSSGGDVGNLEEETVSFSLNVPEPNIANPQTIDIPFGWQIGAAATMSVAIQKIITAWENETKLDVYYLPDGTNGDTGQIIVTETTMSTGLDAMVEFNLEFTGDGAVADHP